MSVWQLETSTDLFRIYVNVHKLIYSIYYSVLLNIYVLKTQRRLNAFGSDSSLDWAPNLVTAEDVKETKMSREDFVYMLVLFAAIPFGHIVKVSGSPARKKLLSFLAGLVVLFTTAGVQASTHSFLTILGTYLIIRMLGPR